MDTRSPKRVRGNPPGEDCYLDKDGWITRDEDKIIRAQQIWKDAAYKPGGKMMVRIQQHFESYQRMLGQTYIPSRPVCTLR
jgi:hypothetical protein